MPQVHRQLNTMEIEVNLVLLVTIGVCDKLAIKLPPEWGAEPVPVEKRIFGKVI